MMSVFSVLRYIGVCILVLCIVAADGNAVKKKKRKRNKAVPCEVSADDLQSTPFQAKCPKVNSLISNISVVGHSGSHCQGLTPDLFVQMNSCFWRNNCTLKYSTQGPNYMLKLYKGNISHCVTKQADKFVISYECTHHKKVKKVHVVRQLTGGRKEGEKKKKKVGAVKDREGVIVSHPDHPWLYRRHHPLSGSLREQLTLQSKKLKSFMYTIRTLNLMAGDNLTVKWTADNQEWESKTFDSDYQLTNGNSRNHNIAGAVRVTFSLDAALHTNGGEGFLVCFKWSKAKKNKGKPAKKKDTCKKLLVAQGCGKRGKG